ncbi:MAG: s-methyl-5-thioribose-1-phosphate isomerase [Syntrophomonadaceae bacterium]|nr:s-methyl-5-thioribose-1-phosphate isomerase [Syntrophomonadaceae bacterium]
MSNPLLMQINNTVFLRDESLVMVDRRCLPSKIVEVVCNDYEDVARAIEEMVVQGAGDIAITAGYGLYLAAIHIESRSTCDAYEARQLLLTARERLVATRPTGFHLNALLGRMLENINWEQSGWSRQLLTSINKAITKQQLCSKLTGKWGDTILEDGDCILTHCFPGAGLLYMLSYARDQKKQIQVISTETRPYLQGARLTAWSVSELGISVTLITDNMAAYCMSHGMITKVFTAADRIAMDGTIANKVGTFQLAIAATYHNIPFYILGYGGPDRRCPVGKEIIVEIRNSEEVLSINGTKNTGEKVKGFYPAFDLTPPELVTAIITDRGIIAPGEVNTYWSLPA